MFIGSKTLWFYFFICFWMLFYKWSVPGGSAIPGPTATKVEQAPTASSSSKKQFNIVGPAWGPYQILS